MIKSNFCNTGNKITNQVFPVSTFVRVSLTARGNQLYDIFSFQIIFVEKSIPNKSDDIQTENNLFDPIVLADISTNELNDSTVWHLADQNDVEKDNQILYVTYQDPELGNRTVKLVNQMVK